MARGYNEQLSVSIVDSNAIVADRIGPSLLTNPSVISVARGFGLRGCASSLPGAGANVSHDGAC
jgi:hypothetical protein